MRKEWKAVICAFLAVLMAFAALEFVFPIFAEAAPASIRRGDRGETVKKIQDRLKRWGYYKGAVDGIFGPATEAAVKAFQRRYGLTADGIVGPKTAPLIGISLPAKSTASSGSNSQYSKDVYLLASLVHAESKGEPYRGKVAVAAVVLNRVSSSKFPNTLAGVIYQPGAFQVVQNGTINQAPDSEAIRAARDAFNGVDPTNGCLFFYNPNTAQSAWIRSRPIVLRIGDHVFTK